VLMKVLKPLLRGSLRKYRAVQGEDVAAAMVGAANRRVPSGIYIYEGKRILSDIEK
jgi:hypothetical protein